ncbi:MAG: hypothetical protein Q9M40_06935 [Sulfurimonas sp.]|nr:hypothetical protein [Sulfurimonas sp.]
MMNSDTKKLSDKEILFNSIINKYGTYNLSKSQASRILNRSIPSLDRDRINSKGPSFKKDKSGNVYYPVMSITDWLLKMEHTYESQV